MKFLKDSGNPNEIWKECSNNDGWGAFYIKGAANFNCGKCNTLICTKCDNKHDPAKFSCLEFANSLLGEEGQEALANEHFDMSCPVCQYKYKRDGGCPSMTCISPHCKNLKKPTMFCIFCGFEITLEETHGDHTNSCEKRPVWRYYNNN